MFLQTPIADVLQVVGYGNVSACLHVHQGCLNRDAIWMNLGT